MLLFKSLENALREHGDRKAFYIKDTGYTYLGFTEKVSAIRAALRARDDLAGKHIGLVANDDLATYAAIIAVWLEGKAYVPLSPQTPTGRNENMLLQAAITLILDSSEQPLFPDHPTIRSNQLPPAPANLTPNPVPGNELAYILFTSGTTGVPKAVPITRDNLSAFIDSFFRLGLELGHEDKWLQMFELTFDLSIFSFLVPLLKGACIYTIPKNQVKYSYVYTLLDEHRLTVALMIPSIIQYLQPYFAEIDCPALKYSLFCGEALPLGTTEKWSRCVPNARIINVYGPSEATIFCTHYSFRRDAPNATHKGILSIGRPMEGTHTLLVTPENDTDSRDASLNREVRPRPAGQGEIGELCLASVQLTPGYLNDEAKNTGSFFRYEYKGQPQRFYRTGDLCLLDTDDDLLYVGRLDSQVKIQGYRVELPEVEFHARTFLPAANLIALPVPNRSDNLEIVLLIEGEPFDTRPLTDYLKTKLSPYMIPTQIRFEPAFPQNANGKTDRSGLVNKLLS
ncbi:MAG TPA: AMP-binding protein [Puia sp.]|jgi:amino acid adenylation domain-containing protein